METPVKKIKTIKYGGVELAQLTEHVSNPHTPVKAEDISLPTADKQAVAIGIRDSHNILLIGEAGTGKTSIGRHLAYIRKQPVYRISMTAYTTPDELIGRMAVANGATYFEYGTVVKAMLEGAILIIDEINMTPADCLSVLHAITDDDKAITLQDGTVIHAHADFRVIGTMNPNYEGTKTLNKAFIDRFSVVIGVQTLTANKEIDLLVKRTGIDKELAEKLVIIATYARKDYIEQKIVSYISTRTLLSIGKLIMQGLDSKQAYNVAVLQKISNKDERKAVSDFYLAVFKLPEGHVNDDLTPVITTKAEIASYQERIAQEELRRTEAENKVLRFAQEKSELAVDKQIAESQVANLQEKYTHTENELTEVKLQLDAYKKLESIIKTVSQHIHKDEPAIKEEVKGEPLPDHMSICTTCGQQVNDKKETQWDNDAQPYCLQCFTKSFPNK